MTVYVDDAKIHFRGCLMCHMFADSLEELHAMAQAIGLKRSWFQKGDTLAHYDVSLSKRKLAEERGAVRVDRDWVVARIRESRKWKEAAPKAVAS